LPCFLVFAAGSIFLICGKGLQKTQNQKAEKKPFLPQKKKISFVILGKI